MKSDAADQIFNATPFWFWMKEKKRIVTEEGGRFLTEPLRFAKSDNVKFIERGGTVSLQDKEFLTVAVYDWRYLVDSIVRFGIDDQKNRGKNQIISLRKAKLENSKDSLTDKIETVLFGKSSDKGGIGFHGLQDVVPGDPTASVTFGGINPSAGNDTWWRSQTKNMTGLSLASFRYRTKGPDIRRPMVEVDRVKEDSERGCFGRFFQRVFDGSEELLAVDGLR